MEENTVQKKVEMIEKIFAQTRDEKLRRSLLEEVVSCRMEPIKVRPSNVNTFPKKRPDIRKTRRPVSKIRKLICALLLPIETMCEIMVNRPWLALFAIFGVILFIGKFISARAAGIMAFSMILIFALIRREEISGTEDDWYWNWLQVYNSTWDKNDGDLPGFYARRLTIPADPYRKF
jgi:hypothetical protein